MNEEDHVKAEGEALVRGWLAAVDRVGPEGYTALASFDEAPAQARADSHYWSDCFFSPQASPHRPGADVRRRIHRATEATCDLLQHEYTAGEIRLRVTESRNFTLIQIQEPSAEAILARPEPERGAEILRIAGLLLDLRGHDEDLDSAPSTFQLPAALSGDCVFSTSCGADPFLLPCWSDRIDAGICSGSLFFLCYKKIAQIVGFFNAQQWFEGGPRRP